MKYLLLLVSAIAMITSSSIYNLAREAGADLGQSAAIMAGLVLLPFCAGVLIKS